MNRFGTLQELLRGRIFQGGAAGGQLLLDLIQCAQMVYLCGFQQGIVFAMDDFCLLLSHGFQRFQDLVDAADG